MAAPGGPQSGTGDLGPLSRAGVGRLSALRAGPRGLGWALTARRFRSRPPPGGAALAVERLGGAGPGRCLRVRVGLRAGGPVRRAVPSGGGTSRSSWRRRAGKRGRAAARYLCAMPKGSVRVRPRSVRAVLSAVSASDFTPLLNLSSHSRHSQSPRTTQAAPLPLSRSVVGFFTGFTRARTRGAAPPPPPPPRCPHSSASGEQGAKWRGREAPTGAARRRPPPQIRHCGTRPRLCEKC